MTRVHFLHMTIDKTQVFLLISEMSLGPGDHQFYYNHRCRQYNKCQQSHQQIYPEHHDQNAYDCGKTCNHLCQADRKCLINCFNIIYHPALYLTMSLAVKEFKGQSVKLN